MVKTYEQYCSEIHELARKQLAAWDQEFDSLRSELAHLGFSVHDLSDLPKARLSRQRLSAEWGNARLNIMRDQHSSGGIDGLYELSLFMDGKAEFSIPASLLDPEYNPSEFGEVFFPRVSYSDAIKVAEKVSQLLSY
jgi:hypothetical protein